MSVETVGNISIPRQPPRYWWDAKLEEHGAANIVNRVWYRMKPENRLIAWLAAPTEDWRHAKVARPVSA